MAPPISSAIPKRTRTQDSRDNGRGRGCRFRGDGDPGAIIQAYWSIGPAGKLILPGITPADQTTNLPLQVLPFGNKSILGNLYGMISTDIDIPRLATLAMTQDLKLDKLVTGKFKLEDINDVADKMLKRQIRGRWAPLGTKGGTQARVLE